MRGTWWAALVGVLLCLCAGPALAQDDKADDDDDEYETERFGARLGIWYRPEMDMQVQLNGRAIPGLPGGGGAIGNILPGTDIDVERDLGVTQTPTSDYMFENGILEAEVFFDSRWVSLSVWGVMPFAYEGETVLSQTINFAGVSFTVNQPVESRFEQWFGSADVKINLLNNGIIAISPLVGLRVMGLDWEIRAGAPANITADTSDIDSPILFGDDQVIPFPVIGAEVKVGIRRWFEVDAKLAGIYISYSDLEGGSIQGDLGATVWPIPWVGLRLGGRYVTFDFESKDQNDRNSFDFDLDYLGFNIALIVRI